MWKLGRGRVLLDEPPEEEDGLRGGPPPAAAAAQAQVQGASFRGWKEVTSLFNKDDEQHLLERCKSPKSKGTNLRLKEELKAEKKSGFWDNLVLKQNIQSKKPDEIEGWEPPKLALEDISADPEDTVGGHPSWSGWEDDAKGSTKYTSLASSANSSRWSLRSAGRLRLSVVPSMLLEGCVLVPLLQAESHGCGPRRGTGTCCPPSQIQKRGHSNENADPELRRKERRT
ncbi:PREDICTED: testis development-related protein isoform X3 [Rhinopithecus bieti]|uniref:testis development-related protein isoform X3 n=1 Tax=Rhinopithecus bieti TaxID=61621 RepID=UPI00083BE0C9|nr:PREDICTED: testis development-related protein isoform X3 [Rhinopithecus bieti]XP_017742550.1 PREDICTED: testis development-related protein isoform X3 [Rhinopithecus bieti]